VNQPAAAAISPTAPRPVLRGTLHLGAALVAPFGLALMLRMSESARAYVGAAIFGATLIACFGVSASYHLGRWRGSLHRSMKRIDHAMIFALIAGTYTPFCLLVLGGGWGISMLSVVWTIAGAGMLLKIAWPDAPRWLSVGLYLGVGWLAIIAAAPIVSALPAAALAVLVLGGALYSLGAVTYALRRPDPNPRIFGYHEVFHALVVAGALTHFSLVTFYVLPA
jgi:hemolysin III